MQETLSRQKTQFPLATEVSNTVEFPLNTPKTGADRGFFEINLNQIPSEPIQTKKPAPIHGNETATLLSNADLLLKHGENELAVHLLRKCLYLNSHHPEALKRLSVALTKEKDLPLKVKAFEALVKSDLCFETMAKLAHCYYQQNQDQKAYQTYVKALEMLTEESSELFEVYKNMGNIFMREGDFESAEEFYNKAFVINANSDVLHVNLGTLSLQQQSHDLAVTRFRTALEINPRNDKAWVGLALVHNAMGDLVLARANVENALDINASNRTAVHLAASWAIRDFDYGFAAEILENFVCSVECDEEMSLVLIHVFCVRNQFIEAQLELEKLLLWNPTNEKLLQVEQEIKNAQRK